MSSSRKVLFVGLILLLAIFFRFAGLAALPLSSDEARLAVQAVEIGQQRDFQPISQPLYVILTTLIFDLFKAGTFTARFIPALSGVLLVLLPFLLISKPSGFPEKKKVLLAFILAIDPVLISWSRQADSLMPVIFLTALIIGLAATNRQLPAIILLPLAGMGGERFFPILIAGIFAVLLTMIIDTLMIQSQTDVFLILKHQVSRESGKAFLLSFFLCGTACLAFPSGISAIGDGLALGLRPNPIHDFRSVGNLPLLIALFVYEGAGFVLFLIALIQNIKNGEKTKVFIMSVILSAAAFLILLNQGILFLPWLVIPLWYFGADVLLKITPLRKSEVDIYTFFALLIPPALSLFLLFRAAEMLKLGDLSLPLTVYWQNQQLVTPLSRFHAYLLIILICIVVFAILLPMVLEYFSPGRIRRGLLHGTLIVVLYGTILNAWSAAGLHHASDDPFQTGTSGRHELSLGSQIQQIPNELSAVLQESGWRSVGFLRPDEGLVLISDDPMLRWEFINKPQVTFSKILSPAASTPAFVITAGQETDELKSGSIGMISDWKSTDNWQTYTPTDWFRWLLYREPVIQKQTITLWQNAADFIEYQTN